MFVSLSDTLQENFGLTPVEAMACGLPAVVSDWAGYQETVRHGETGFRAKTVWAPAEDDLVGLSGYVPWRETQLPLSQAVMIDLDAVADHLFTLCSNAETRRTMGEVARAWVVAEFAAPLIVARMEALWTELAAHATTLEKRPASPSAGLYESVASHELASYAPEFATGEERVMLTEYGREVLCGGCLMPLTDEMKSHYRQDVLTDLLSAMKLGHFFGRGLPLSDLAAQASRKHGLSPPAAKRSLIWLVKHGLARLKA